MDGETSTLSLKDDTQICGPGSRRGKLTETNRKVEIKELSRVCAARKNYPAKLEEARERTIDPAVEPKNRDCHAHNGGEQEARSRFR